MTSYWVTKRNSLSTHISDLSAWRTLFASSLIITENYRWFCYRKPENKHSKNEIAYITIWLFQISCKMFCYVSVRTLRFFEKKAKKNSMKLIFCTIAFPRNRTLLAKSKIFKNNFIGASSTKCSLFLLDNSNTLCDFKFLVTIQIMRFFRNKWVLLYWLRY